jgi:hypothetical protein
MASYWVFRPPFQFLLPDWKPIPGYPAVAAAWAGFALVLLSFRLLGTGPAGDDLPPRGARWGLAAVLMVGAWMRLHRFAEFHPTWGWDPFWEIIETRNTIELGENALLFNVGSREPFFTYVLALLWRIVPGASPYVIANLGSALIDLAGVWVLYLAGRELAGRRAGLFAAALAAVSKPLVIMSLACTRGVSTPLGAALVLLFSLRAFRRPDQRHLLQWGAAAGAAAWTYTGIRPLLLWTVLSVLAAVLVRRDTLRAGWPSFLLALAGGGGIAAGFLERNAFAGKATPIVGPLFDGRVLAALGIAAAGAWFLLSRRPPERSAPSLRAWAAGAVLACLLVLPLALHPLFANHLMNSSQVFRKSLADGAAALGAGLDRTWTHLFVGGWLLDREDMNILWDTCLDLVSIPALLLGLAAFLARPAWTPAWVLLSAAAGFAPYALSDDPHTVRLMSGMPAALALSALALDRLWSAFRALAPGAAAARIAAAALAVAGLAAAGTIDGRVWGAFAAQVDRNVEIDRLLQAEPGGARAYYAPAGDFFLLHQHAVQREGGRPAYLMKASNPIDLAPGEPVPVVVVYACLSPDFGDEESRLGALRRHYPDLPCRSIALRNGKGMCRLEVPASRVREDGTGLFFVRRSPAPSWRRAFPAWNCGLARGNCLSREDLAPAPDAPLPDGRDGQGARITGRIRVPRAGRVVFRVDTADILALAVDGRLALDHRPRPGAATLVERGIRLEAGDHPVTMRVHMRGNALPRVQVILPGETQVRDLSEIGV